MNHNPLQLLFRLLVNSAFYHRLQLGIVILMFCALAACESSILAGSIPVSPMPIQNSGRLVFTSDRTGNDDIFAMNADGTDLVNLTNNPAKDEDASWSPDGMRIAFTSNRDGKWRIYLMNADGSSVTAVTDDQLSSGRPVWSHDGRQLAFTAGSDASLKDHGIFVINVDGTHLMRLPNVADNSQLVDWTLDNKRILVLGGSPYNIYSVDVAGSGLINLTCNSVSDFLAHRSGSNFESVLSPDGSQIAFVSDRDHNWEIYLVNIDGSGIKNLTNSSGYDLGLAWSPDGTRIAYLTKPSPDTAMELHLMNRDGSNVTQLKYDWEPSNPIVSPVWSRDSKYLAVVGACQNDPCNQEILVLNVDGSGLTNVTHNPANDTDPAWQP